jgi:uncharacterized membrane protein YbhN (UPF0104 family)
VTLPRREPPLIPALSQAPAAGATAPEVRVDDQFEPRVRIPADLLRCLIGSTEICLLVGLALLARETTHGVELTAVGASHFLPKVLIPIVRFAASAALFILPIALAFRLLYHRQLRRLVEAAVAGGITVAGVALANFLLGYRAAAQLYHALSIQSASGARHPMALYGLLAGLAAYITVIGLSGRPRWRTAFWLAIGFYGLVSLADSHTTVLSLLITLLLGSAIGSGLRYAAGSTSERPTATDIAAALASVGAAVVEMRRIWDAGTETRRYAATLRSGSRLDVTVFDRDQQAADAFYRLYRRLRLKTQVSRSAPLTLERAVERRALLTYAVEDAGVPTPRLRALIKVGPEAAVLANEHHGGITLAELDGEPTDARLAQVWDTVLRLHAHRVTHRALTADRILFTSDDGGAGGQGTEGDAARHGTGGAGGQGTDGGAASHGTGGGGGQGTEGDAARHGTGGAGGQGTEGDAARHGTGGAGGQGTEGGAASHGTGGGGGQGTEGDVASHDGRPPAPGSRVMLLEPGDGDVAASDLQLRLDLTQLLAELALLVGPERSADLALRKIGRSELIAMVPLLQPVALHRSTRAALRRRKDVLPALRKQLQASVPAGQLAPVQLERIRPRTLVTLVASLIAGYVLIAQFAKVDLAHVFITADWPWTLVALALSAATYVGAAWALSGFVLERLNPVRTFLAQVAGSFVTLVTPAAVGGVALNIRYLRQADVAPADAAASVGVSQVVAFCLHMLLLIVFTAVTGASQAHSLHPPTWLYIALAVLAAGVLALLALPAGRRLIRSRLGPALGQAIPRLLDVAQRPVKLAEGIGGTLLLTTAYILCLAACVRALGGSAPLASIAVVYLTGNAIGSVVPTPGGIGAVEAALSAGLAAAGLPGATALSSVLLFRTLIFWLPVPLGWAAMNYLQRHHAL